MNLLVPCCLFSRRRSPLTPGSASAKPTGKAQSESKRASPFQRSRLRIACAIVGLMLGGSSDVRAQEAVPKTLETWGTLPEHPRLFARAERWAALKEQLARDAVSQKMFALIRARAESVVVGPDMEYIDRGSFLHGPMRQVQGRIIGLAMTYRLTGEPRFLQRAKKEMDQLAALPSWYPQHFLDTAEAALGMAVGYDWLYADLTPAERDRYATALVDRALKESLSEEKNRSWLTNRNNWNPVCHAGLAAAALVVAEREPTLARQIVERSRRNVHYAAEIYAPSGAYSEGPGYWAYGTTFYVLLTEQLRSVFGNSGELERAPGFLRTGDYILQMTAPSGDMFNFADSTPEFGFEPVMFWFARELNRPDLVRRALAALDTMRPYLTSDTPRDDASRLQPLGLIWWNPKVAQVPAPTPPPLAWWSEGGAQPQAAMRTAWDDPRATYVAIKGGKALDSHAHMDVGSFILEQDGVRWAVDLGRESYPLARANGVGGDLFNNAQGSKRWQIFRAGPDAHNILRFDQRPQRVDGTGTMRPAAHATPQQPGFVLDLTPVYRDEAKRVERGIQLRLDGTVLFQDEWDLQDVARTLTWQWLTYATATRKGDGVELTQDGKMLQLSVVTPDKVEWLIEDVSAPRAAFDSPNPHLRRVSIRVVAAAGSTSRLVVSTGSWRSGTKPPVVPLADW